MQFKINPKISSTKALRVIPVFESENGETQTETPNYPLLSPALFSGKKDTSYSLGAHGRLLLLVGLGKEPDYKNIENSYRRILIKNSSLLEKEVVLDFPDSGRSAMLASPMLTSWAILTVSSVHPLARRMMLKSICWKS